MEHSATFETGETYFAESFRQSLDYLSRFRRWQIPIAGLILAAGASWLIYQPGYFPGVFVFLGIGQIADFYRYRRGWINSYRGRFTDEATGSVTLTATDSGLALRGLDNGHTVDWRAVSTFHSTPKGLLFSVADKQPIFVPEAAFKDRRTKPFVMRKAASRGRGRASR